MKKQNYYIVGTVQEIELRKAAKKLKNNSKLSKPVDEPKYMPGFTITDKKLGAIVVCRLDDLAKVLEMSPADMFCDPMLDCWNAIAKKKYFPIKELKFDENEKRTGLVEF